MQALCSSIPGVSGAEGAGQIRLQVLLPSLNVMAVLPLSPGASVAVCYLKRCEGAPSIPAEP